MVDDQLSTDDKQGLLNNLKASIEASDVAVELKSQATQLVFGEGNPDADIVFVGEAPGKQEDLQGRPFVGASGKFFDEMLAKAGFDRTDVYITNIVKYRPPNNRDPSTDEKRQFWPFLMEQIDIIAPRVVITLGRHSGSCFISDLVISRDHGRMRRVKHGASEYVVIPLYHPAAALYNGSMRQVLIDDFIKAADYARGE